MLSLFFRFILFIYDTTSKIDEYIVKREREKIEVLWPVYASPEDQLLCLQYDLINEVTKMEADPNTSEQRWLDMLILCKRANLWSNTNMESDLREEMLELERIIKRRVASWKA